MYINVVSRATTSMVQQLRDSYEHCMNIADVQQEKSKVVALSIRAAFQPKVAVPVAKRVKRPNTLSMVQFKSGSAYRTWVPTIRDAEASPLDATMLWLDHLNREFRQCRRREIRMMTAT